ncbi:MAG: hypothetical protein JSS83_18750 [Cyanobacteria bacterium SZAS LIN-3]|nr:hypothetical protein [Cyanobacteria bacterium SZAS LIN-3]
MNTLSKSCLTLASAVTLLALAAPASAQTVDTAAQTTVQTAASADSNDKKTELKLPSFKDKFELGLENAFKNAWVDVNGVSYHFKRNPKHNERNWGVGLEFPVSDRSTVLVGTYNNSNWRQSNYVWYEYTPWHIGPVKFGLMGGGVTGYRSGMNVMPVAGLAFTGGSDRVGFNIVCLPPVVCAASIKFKVW